MRRWVVALVAARGTILAPGDLHSERLAAGQARNALDDPALALGRSVRRDLAAGAPIAEADLLRHQVVASGQMVELVWELGRVRLTAQGRAVAGGGLGDRIGVRRDGQPTVQGRIIGPGLVQVR